MKIQSKFVLFSKTSLTKQVIVVLLFNTIIALLINRFVGRANFYHNFIISQLIGISIFLCLHSVYRFRYYYFHKTDRKFSVTFVSLILGTIIGVSFATIYIVSASRVTITDFLASSYDNFIQNLLIGLLFGSVIIYFFMSRENLLNAKAKLQEYKLSILDNEKRMIESKLKLLQSQIEPHFLFNTLSNIIGLIEKEPTRSKTMLESLTRYLRATLNYTRQESAVIEDELNMITAYLNIFKERMGERLKYKIDIDKKLYQYPFPPMLLQPIVENAIKHGLESSIEGGSIKISGQYYKNKIRLIVEDTGSGLEQESGKGVGLSNVQQRLKALFGESATLILHNRQETGLRVIIELPHDCN